MKAKMPGQHVTNCHNLTDAQDCHAPAVLSGSHSDSIVLGGAYDGDLGVVGAIAAIRALREEGFMPQKSIEAVMFTTEEASRFNVPCLGR